MIFTNVLYSTEKNENKETVDPSKYISKDLIGRSGRIIKGRGQLRYNSKSPRDRMDTPPHWKKESYKPQDNTIDRYNTKTKSISPSPNNRDYQNNRQSRRENDSPRPNHRANDNNNSNNRNLQENEQFHREKKRKNDVWKDVSEKNDDKSKRHKKDELEDYGDVDKFERINQKNSHQKRSSSLEKARKIDRERMNYKANKSKNTIQNIKQERVEGPESENIIYPYGDESDESLKHKRSDKIIVDNRLGQSKPKIHSDKDEEMKRKSGNYDNLEKLKIDSHVTRKRSTSESYKQKSTSPIDAKRHTQSPPAHLVAKWQNRREKIMIRRSPISRSNERNQSRSRYSPRRRSSRYSKSPRSDKNKHESKPREEHRVSNNNIRKISKDRSSSGTMDSSLSSAGSSVINDSTSNQQVENNKEKKIDMPSTSADKIKENELKTENLTEKETLMVLKPPEKPWLTNQWKTEDEEANKKVQKITNNSILAKLREDDQKKSQEKQEKPSATSESRQDLKKIQSPVSQSISKYRSPSGTKSSNNDRSSFSSSSSSRSDSRRRSRSHSRSRSYYKRKYRNSHYYRSSKRSTSRSLRKYRSRSRSYSKSSRKRYSSRSSSTSRSSRYIRSTRRNYRGLGFRRPSVSPRPRK